MAMVIARGVVMMSHRAALRWTCVTLALALAPARASAQTFPFGRIEAGTLNPDGLFNTTLALGAALGITSHSSSFLLRLVRQSQNRNEGPDVSQGRTFVLFDWELTAKPNGPQDRQAFIRVGAGYLFRSPFKSTGVADLGLGLRYRLVRGVTMVGALVDQMAWLPYQAYSVCGSGICDQYAVRAELQQNVGLLVDVEIAPR